jgi:phosphoglycerate dehydrogenase-like enzyme
VFDRHLSEDEAAAMLAPFDVLCTIRERMALPRTPIARLPRLRLVTIVGASIANLDMAAATDHGIVIVHSDFRSGAFDGIANATPELAWGLMLATARHIAHEDRRVREGGWRSSTGLILAGRTLGLLGLGRPQYPKGGGGSSLK